MDVTTIVDKLSVPDGHVYRIQVLEDGELTGSHVLEREAAIRKLVENGHSEGIAEDMIDNAQVPPSWADRLPEPPERWSEFGTER